MSKKSKGSRPKPRSRPKIGIDAVGVLAIIINFVIASGIIYIATLMFVFTAVEFLLFPARIVNVVGVLTVILSVPEWIYVLVLSQPLTLIIASIGGISTISIRLLLAK